MKELLKERIIKENPSDIFTDDIIDYLKLEPESYKEEISYNIFKDFKVLDKKQKEYYKIVFNNLFKEFDLEIEVLEKLKLDKKNDKMANVEKYINTFVFDQIIESFNEQATKYLLLKKIEKVKKYLDNLNIKEAFNFIQEQKESDKLILSFLYYLAKNDLLELYFKENINFNTTDKSVNKNLLFLYFLGFEDILYIYKEHKYLLYKGSYREIGCDLNNFKFSKEDYAVKEKIIKEVGNDICISTWFCLEKKLIDNYFPKEINEKTIKVINILSLSSLEDFYIENEENALFILQKIYNKNKGYFFYIMSFFSENEREKIIQKIKNKSILDNF